MQKDKTHNYQEPQQSEKISDSQQINKPQQKNKHSFTVGNIGIQSATLVDTQYNMIQLPRSMLPLGVAPGAVIKITIEEDFQQTKNKQELLDRLINKLDIGEYHGGSILGDNNDQPSSKSTATSFEKESNRIQSTSPEQIRTSTKSPGGRRSGSGMKKKPS